MSAILRPVRSYANSRSSVLDIDPKLVCKEMQKEHYAIKEASFELGLLVESPSGFSYYLLYKYKCYEVSYTLNTTTNK